MKVDKTDLSGTFIAFYGESSIDHLVDNISRKLGESLHKAHSISGTFTYADDVSIRELEQIIDQIKSLINVEAHFSFNIEMDVGGSSSCVSYELMLTGGEVTRI